MILEIIKYYGSDETKTEFINHDSEPLMAVIAHDRSHAVVSLLDEGCEHHLLLAKALDKYNIDEYFRIIFDNEGADWTFVCPPNYKNIANKEKRITEFFMPFKDLSYSFISSRSISSAFCAWIFKSSLFLFFQYSFIMSTHYIVTIVLFFRNSLHFLICVLDKRMTFDNRALRYNADAFLCYIRKFGVV